MKKNLLLSAMLCIAVLLTSAFTGDNSIDQDANQTQQMLNSFLPDKVGGFTEVNEIREGVTESLTGCFKSYMNDGDNTVRININISRYDISSAPVDSMQIAIFNIEETTINGLNAKTSTQGQSIKLLVQQGSVSVSFSNNGSLSMDALKTFASQLNYSFITNL